jgi:hypothetical protein|tara:strand:+ start:1427 stop:1591 length:165 start_codon:yes stop_codon:yes gene_type:complete
LEADKLLTLVRVLKEMRENMDWEAIEQIVSTAKSIIEDEELRIKTGNGTKPSQS